MKKFFTLVFIFALTAVVSNELLAQDIRFGLRAGYNNSKINYKNDPGVTTNNISGGHLGFVTEFDFNRYWGLQTGVFATSKGGKERIHVLDETDHRIHDLNITFRLFYVEVPVLAVARIPLESCDLLGFVGPYVSYGVLDRMTAEYRGEKEYTNYHFDNEDQLKPFDWGLNFGVGIEVVEHLQISCHYEMGLSNFCDRTVNEYKNRNFSVSLGWLF